MILQGNNLIIKANGTQLAKSKTCSIDMGVDTFEVSSPTTGTWKTHMCKRKGWNVSCNHLVTVAGWSSELLKLGSIVTLTLEVRNGGTNYNFAGFYSGAVSNSRTYNPTGIYWHPTLKMFVALSNDTYYKYWAYQNPSAPAETYFTTPDPFATYVDVSTSKSYAVDTEGGSMVELRSYSGQAIVENVQVNARRGALASGGFKFLGTGELSLVTT